jgi:hypothetical protein
MPILYGLLVEEGRTCQESGDAPIKAKVRTTRPRRVLQTRRRSTPRAGIPTKPRPVSGMLARGRCGKIKL